MPNGLLGLNVRTLGVSRDQILSAVRAIGCAFVLVQDDPDLIAPLRAMGVKTVYRQSGDETLILAPSVFVQTRAEKGADYIALTNELDPTPEQLAYTMECMKYAHKIGVKCVINNYSTDRSKAQWQASTSVLQWAADHGMANGLHVYQRNSERAGSYDWIDIKRQIGGLWLVTEYAFYVDAYHGYRGVLNPRQYGAFFDATLPLFEAEQMPCLLFSGDNWPLSNEGRASGFGVLDNADVLKEITRVNQTFTFTGVKPVITIPDRTTLGAPVSVAVTKTVADAVNIRSTPNRTSGDVLGTFKTGDTITIRPKHTDLLDNYLWYAIEAPKVGWAANIFEFKQLVPPTSVFTPEQEAAIRVIVREVLNGTVENATF